jgi:hypothetical protein
VISPGRQKFSFASPDKFLRVLNLAQQNCQEFVDSCNFDSSHLGSLFFGDVDVARAGEKAWRG